MKANMGTADIAIRIGIAAVIAILFWQDIISGVLGYILMAFAIVFLLTSFVSFCPLYTLLGVNTCKIKK